MINNWKIPFYRFDGRKEFLRFSSTDSAEKPITILEQKDGTLKAVYAMVSHRDVYTDLAEMADALSTNIQEDTNE